MADSSSFLWQKNGQNPNTAYDQKLFGCRHQESDAEQGNIHHQYLWA
jgi:hypothetical protein